MERLKLLKNIFGITNDITHSLFSSIIILDDLIHDHDGGYETKARLLHLDTQIQAVIRSFMELRSQIMWHYWSDLSKTILKDRNRNLKVGIGKTILIFSFWTVFQVSNCLV